MMKAFAHTAAVVLVVTTAGLAIAGCGGDSADEQRLAQDRLETARAEGARQARMEERAKQAAADTKELKRQIAALRRSRRSSSTGSSNPSSTSRSTAGRTTSAPRGNACGGGLFVNGVTTCPFAENVRSAYYENGGSSTVEVYSPVTGQTYSMRCVGGSTTTCTGGNGARVSF